MKKVIFALLMGFAGIVNAGPIAALSTASFGPAIIAAPFVHAAQISSDSPTLFQSVLTQCKGCGYNGESTVYSYEMSESKTKTIVK